MTQAKMSYTVDLVSEDSFYENLLLGVTKILEATPRVCKVMVNRSQPCERSAITNWEQKHSVPLPEDLRKFYASSDGFLLRWSYKYSAEEILPVGVININQLNDLVLSPALKDLLDNALAKQQEEGKFPSLNIKSKVLELDDCRSFGKVCLVFSEGHWSVWLLSNNGTWNWLSDSFTKYLRMALVHLGLPAWQAVICNLGTIPWAEPLYNLMAPHLLCNYESPKAMSSPPALNKIDPNIFKSTTKHFGSRSIAANRPGASNNV